MKDKPMIFLGILLIVALCLIVFYQVSTDPFSDIKQIQQTESHIHGQENVPKMNFTAEMKTYGDMCAGCHGKIGEGASGFPSLQNLNLSLDEIKDIIVNGKGNMEGLSHIKEPMLTKLAKFVMKL
jgi:hypothetical protein